MNFIFSSLLLVLLAASVDATSVPRLHSKSFRKTVLQSGSATRGWDGYQNSYRFCQRQLGTRSLASVKEWCSFAKTHPLKAGMAYGVVEVREGSRNNARTVNVESTCGRGHIGTGDNSVGSNPILCTYFAKTPASLPTRCAMAFDDPHIQTFDRLRFDCQASGDFILSRDLKDMDNGFMVQGRIQKFNPKYGSVTIGAVVRTGHANEPTVEVDFKDQQPKNRICVFRYHVDGKEVDADGLWASEGSVAADPEGNVHIFRSNNDRYFFYAHTKTTFHMLVRYHEFFGCYMNIKVCVTDAVIARTNIEGLFGSPDNNVMNDFTNNKGLSPLDLRRLDAAGIFKYCRDTWCVAHKKLSLFRVPGSTEQCSAPFDPKLDEEVEKATDEVKDDCNNDPQCIVDRVVTGDKEAGDRVLEDQKDADKDEKIPEEEEDDSEKEDDTTEEQDKARKEKKAKEDAKESKSESESVDEPTPDASSSDSSSDDKAFTKGDPHFKTFGGELFDFHGGCDLVLVKNPTFDNNKGLDIHIRTKIVDWWSYVSAVGVKVGEDTLELNGDDQKNWLYINGEPVIHDDLEDGKWYMTTFAGYTLRYKQSGPNGEANIYLGKYPLAMKTFHSFVHVDVDTKSVENYDGSLGLLGRFPDGARVGRDGETEIHSKNDFGLEWQVREDEAQVFHTYEGAVRAPQMCVIPNKTAGASAMRTRRLGESAISQDAADQACGHLSADEKKACIYDVLATNDLSMASVW